MSSNGHPSAPRIRLDPSSKGDSSTPSGVSGRRVVLAICVVVLSLWGALTLAMNSWKAAYAAKAEYGRTQIAPLVDPLAKFIPPGVDATEWADAVQDTHAMLHALTAANLLEMDGLQALRTDIETRFQNPQPETVRMNLIGLWDELEKKAGPVLNASLPPPPSSRHAQRVERPKRPALLSH